MLGVGVAGAGYFGGVGFGLFRLGGGSVLAWWVGCGIVGVVVCLVLLRFWGKCVGGE